MKQKQLKKILRRIFFVYYSMKTILFVLSTIFLLSFMQKENPGPAIKYIAFGDSYTICTGTNADSEHWPNILSKHLTEAGIKTELIANPSRNGFSTQNLIDHELPELEKQQADFATLLIGVNDWVREVDAVTYKKNLVYIIDEIQKKLSKKNHLILITIPDFGVTPQGSMYGNGRNISKGIAEFNEIIKAEAKKRNLSCVDIYSLSKYMKESKELVAEDGLHPSAKEYALWEKMILPEALKVLKK
ncbi:MAG: lipolytic protein family [Bacteroidetes bacterium]|jgi:lysophospholipase L1-like esterase|nr:lipolytic protein family [Bacteroidota bacterium]